MASEPQARALLQQWLAPYFQGGMLRYYVENLTPKLAAVLLAERQSPEHLNETADAAGTDIAPAGAVPPLRRTVRAGDVVVSSLPGAAGDHPQTPSTLAAIPPEVQAVPNPEATPVPTEDVRVRCSSCGKSVSNPIRVVGGDGQLYVRAFVQCPECIEAESAPTPAPASKPGSVTITRWAGGATASLKAEVTAEATPALREALKQIQALTQRICERETAMGDRDLADLFAIRAHAEAALRASEERA